MSKRRKDVTFDGDISKGGSSDRVEDPNQVSNNQNSVSDSNSDNENSLNQDSNDDNKSHPEDNTNDEDDNNQHADEGTSNSKSDDNSNNVTEPSNHSTGNNGGDKVTEPPPQQQENNNLNDYPSSSEDNSNQTNDSQDDEATNQSNNNDSNKNNQDESSSVSNNNEDDDNNQNDAKDDKTFNTEDSDEGKTFSPEDNDDESDKSGIVGKALGSSDATNTLSKAKKLKDISEMSKEEAKEQFQSMAVEAGKMKIKAALWSAVSPYLLPIIGIILVIVLVFTMIVGIVGSSSSGGGGGSKQGCKVVKDNSTDVKNSKDADKNAETIYKYLMEHVDGAKSKAVAAHLGNIYVESAQSFDPSTIQGGEKYKEDIAMDPDAGGYAFGISQWDSERRVSLIKYAKKKDKKWDDLGVQLDYMLNHDGSDSETIKKLLKSSDEIDESTESIMNEWERAGDKSSIGERRSAAAKYYSKFNDKDTKSGEDSNIDDTTDAATDNSDAAENSGCEDEEDTGGKTGKSVKANGKSGEVIKQWSSKDKIPKKYKKHISIPDFREKKLDSPEDIFTETGDIGECTELTWAYMSELWKGKQPTNGNGNVIYKAYKAEGAKITNKPTVGYGFSSDPPYAGAADSSVGHTGVVAGVMDDGKWIMANYNLNGESPDRKLTYALVDGNEKEGGIKFFSGIGGKK